MPTVNLNKLSLVVWAEDIAVFREQAAFDVVIPSGTVNSDLTDYPVMVRLSDMPTQFWDNVRNDGGNIRVKTTGGATIPHDIVRLDYDSEDGVLFFLASSLLNASDNTFVIVLGQSTVEGLPIDDENGRNAVWADYEAVHIFGESGGDDRTGKNTMARIYNDPYLFEIDSASSTDLDCHQGVCFDGTYYYTTDDNKICKWNTSWSLVDSNSDPIGDTSIGGTPTINHCGDPCVYDGKLYIPMECYPYNGGYNAHISVFDASDLSFIEAFDISSQGHEAASVAYCEKDDLLYVIDYDGNTSTIYKYDPSDGSYEGGLSTDKAIPERQGITWWRGFFWISQDANDETLRISYSGEVSLGNLTGDSGGVLGQGISGDYEGIGHSEEALLQLADPGTTERVDVWKPLDIDMGAGGGFYNDDEPPSSVGHMRCGVSNFTVFTIGCTVIFDSKGQNRSFVSYWDESTGTANTNRVALAFSNSNSSFGVWDTNNSWLLPSPTVDPSVDTAYRVHVTYNGTTNRTIQVNAGSKNTDLSITAAPSGKDVLLVGMEDESESEVLVGYVGFLYLRNEVLSDDWIKAEYDNLNDPSSFYNISSDSTVSLNKLEASLSVKDIAPSLTLYETDFSEYSVDQTPGDWTERWDLGDTWFNVRDDGDLGGQCLECMIYEDADCYVSWDDVGTPTDVEALSKIRMSDNGYSSSTKITVRGSGSSSTRSGYEVILSKSVSSASFQLRKFTGGTTSYQITTESVSISYDTWYWIRFQVIGTSLKAKFWADGDEEPGTWLLDETDSDVSDPGWVAHVFGSSTLNYGYGDCDYFAVGIDGESPSEPGTFISLNKLNLIGSAKSIAPILSEYIINLGKLSLIGNINSVDPKSGTEIDLNCLSAKASLKDISVSFPEPAIISLDKLSLEATPKDLDIVFHLGSVDATLPALECEARTVTHLSVDRNLPAVICEAHMGARLSVDAKLPAFRFEARMGSRAENLKLPALECEARLSENLILNVDAKLPVLQLSDTRMGSRLEAMLPDMRIEAFLTSDIFLSVDRTLPGLKCEASAYCPNLGSVDANLPMLLIDASIIGDNNFTLDKMLPGLKCLASIYCSSLGIIDAILPDLQIEANLYQEGTMSVDAKLPAVIMAGKGYGTGDGTGGGTMSEKSRFADYILRYSR